MGEYATILNFERNPSSEVQEVHEVQEVTSFLDVEGMQSTVAAERNKILVSRPGWQQGEAHVPRTATRRSCRSYEDGFVVLHDGKEIGRMGRLIGQGAMGDVRSFMLRRQPRRGAAPYEIEVAAKAVRADFAPTKRATMEKALAHEASVTFALGRHVLIASMIRLVVPSPRIDTTAKGILLLSEFVDSGDLESMMHSGKKEYNGDLVEDYEGKLYSDEGAKMWPLSSLTLQIYLAFHTLHTAGVIHQVRAAARRFDVFANLTFCCRRQDFKPANLMMCSNGVVKVTDFGARTRSSRETMKKLD